MNEQFALNKKVVKEFFEEHDIVAIKANTSGDRRDEIYQLLEDLGNAGKAIPFYAIFPGNGKEPITFDGLLSPAGVVERFNEAGIGSGSADVRQVSHPAQ